VKGHQPGRDGEEARFRQFINGIYGFDMEVGDEDAGGVQRVSQSLGQKQGGTRVRYSC
jgi:hypothetical protein